jgi:hypothetical protein
MPSQWYYQSMSAELGPYSADQMREHAASGRIAADTLVRKGKDGKWVNAARIKGLLGQPERPQQSRSAASTASIQRPQTSKLARIHPDVIPASNRKSPPNRTRILAVALSATTLVAALAAIIVTLVGNQLMRNAAATRAPVPTPVAPLAAPATEAHSAWENSFVNPAEAAAYTMSLCPDDVQHENRWPVVSGKRIKLVDDPRINLRMAADMAKQGSHDAALDRAIAQGAALTSPIAVANFLLGLDERSFSRLRESGNSIEAPAADFDALGAGAGRIEGEKASERYYRAIKRKNGVVQIHFDPQYASMTEAAFYATVRDCYDTVAQSRTERAMEIERKQREIEDKEPKWAAGIAINDAAKAIAYARLTSSEKDRVAQIRKMLKAANGFAESGLSREDVRFAYSGEGAPCLFLELSDAIKAKPGPRTAELRELLQWDDATAMSFACDPDLTPFEKEEIRRCGRLLVNHEMLSDLRIQTIRRYDRYLGAAFDNYNKLGLDPAGTNARQRDVGGK